jgi:hypothetical protein
MRKNFIPRDATQPHVIIATGLVEVNAQDAGAFDDGWVTTADFHPASDHIVVACAFCLGPAFLDTSCGLGHFLILRDCTKPQN